MLTASLAITWPISIRSSSARGASRTNMLEPAAFGLTEADLDRVFYHKLSRGRIHDVARADRDLARHLLPHDRRRVHAHPRRRDPPVAARADGAGPEPAGVRHQEEAADHLQAERGRAVRDVPPQELRGPEAVFARRGRDADPAPGRDHRAGRGGTGSGRSSWGCPTAGG